MAAPRTLILNQAREALRGISTGAGYNTTVQRVTGEALVYEQVNNFPTIVLIEDISNPPLLRRFGNLFTDDFRFLTAGYVRGTGDRPRSDHVEDLYDDVCKAFAANATLKLPDGTELVSDIKPDGNRQTDGGLWEPKGFFIQRWIATSNRSYPGP